MQQSVRYHEFDALRAFAMFLGLVLHGLLSFMPVPFWPAQDIRQNPEINHAIVTLIHGFRMPLFFFLSGFFMMMLWKKRGPAQLAANRALRVLVPLVVGTIFVFPTIGFIATLGGAKRAQIAERQVSLPERPAKARTVWEAVRFGHEEKLRQSLDERTDVNARDENGLSLLTWAAMEGNEEITALLIERGARVNERDKENRIALHGAAFFGRVGVVKQLLEAGAEVNATGSLRDTPLDSAHAGMETVKWIAGMLRMKIDITEIEKNRPLVQAALRQAGAKSGKEMATENRTKSERKREGITGLVRLLAFFPVVHHLWFLNYLAWFTAAFLVIAALVRAVKARPLPGFLLRRPICFTWLIPLTWLAQTEMNSPFGPDTASGILPWPPIFLYYSIFVCFGVLCFGREEFMKSTRYGWVVYLVLAAVTGLCGAAPDWMGLDFGPYRSRLEPVWAAIFVWMATFGLIGAFRFIFRKENPTVRWLSDSAYWLYLAHLPLMMFLQIVVSDWEFPWFPKFLFVLGTTTAILLFLYQYLVRYTFIGAILNGRKSRPQ